MHRQVAVEFSWWSRISHLAPRYCIEETLGGLEELVIGRGRPVFKELSADSDLYGNRTDRWWFGCAEAGWPNLKGFGWSDGERKSDILFLELDALRFLESWILRERSGVLVSFFYFLGSTGRSRRSFSRQNS